MKYKIKYLLLLVLIFWCVSLPAQVIDSSILNLDRILRSREFTPDRFGPAKWLSDGSAYTTLEPSQVKNGGTDIIKYDPKTGTKEVMVPATSLVPEKDTNTLDIEDYEWSADGKLLLIYTNSARVWRQNTRGDYWVYNSDTRKLQKLGGDASPSTLMFAKFSPDGTKAGYVCKNNLFVEDLSNNKITQLTFDGSRTIINGTFDWVYEEEYDLRDGFRWSPDSKHIAYWQLDAAGVNDFNLINNTDSLYSKIIPVQYPKVGTTLSACKVGVVNASGGQTKWFDVPGDSRNNYIGRMDWAGNSEEIVCQHFNRRQNIDEVMLGDINTGSVRTILTEKDDAWVDVVNDLKWLNDGKNFTWISERDGWRHVYIVSRSGDKTTLVTQGNFDVESIQLIDDKGGWLYFIASPDNPAQRYLYRSKLKGNSKPERLTPITQPGTHTYQISPNAKIALHGYSTFDTPPVLELITLPDHKVKSVIYDNAKLKAKFNSLKKLPVEFFRIDIGSGIQLDGWKIKPYNFDPVKKYPVLFYVYGEPAAQTVLDSWDGFTNFWHLMLAQQGYLIVSMDNRGTPAPRGRDWRKSIYQNIGTLSSYDQSTAVRKIINDWTYVDSSRIAVWGWSGGASLSLNAIFRYPDIYKTAMAVAPVTDERLYDATYQERYMGLLKDNEDVYKKCSAITYAQQLKGNLLIVHGTGDDNVHFQNTELLINKLISENKPFTMMAYPNRSHGIYEGRNTRLHLFELLTRYLKNNVPSGPR